jgi:hypothetical protein
MCECSKRQALNQLPGFMLCDPHVTSQRHINNLPPKILIFLTVPQIRA